MKTNESLVVDMIYDEPDLVHVRGNHDLFTAIAPLFHGDDIAHVVQADLIDMSVNFAEDQFANTRLLTGRSGGFENFRK